MTRSIATIMVALLLISSMGGLSYGQSSGELQAPRQTTIFLTDPTETEQMQESINDTYYDTGTVVFPLDEATQKVKDLAQGLDTIEAKIRKLDAKYGITNEEYSKTRKDIILIMDSINQTTKKLSASLKKIVYFQGSILQAADQIKDIRQTLDETTNYMQSFSVFLYKLNNDYYTDEGKLDEIKLFIKSEQNISEQLANTAMVENVMENMNTLTDTLKTQEKEAINRMKESNKKRSELNKIIKEYDSRLSNLQEQKNFLNNYLTFFDKNGSAQAISLEFPGLFDTKPELLYSIKNMVAQIDKKSYDTASFDVEKKLKELEDTEAFATRDPKAAPLSWPTYPIRKITHYFNDPSGEKDFQTSYPGIEIATPQGTPLYAMDEGLVYEVANKDGIGISWMAIINKAGQIMIYLYPNQIDVQEGDIVRRGQFIGYSGGEPGTKGAGFAAGGPNLTLLIIQDSKFIDPLPLLDLSVIQDRSNLPSSYHFDYLQDKYNLPREGYTDKPFTGSSIAERRENFLNTYAAGSYRQVELWEKASEGTNIDLDVGICIAFAESTLGNYLSTANNIGNVGNNDRGDRVSYAAPIIGARLIYTTLNNAYLGDYNILLDYNGYGNPDGKNYATSKYNWQNNVRNCLTQIKGYYVPDDFPVRVGPNPSK